MTDHQLPLDFLLIDIRIPPLPPILDHELRVVLKRHQNGALEGPGDWVSGQYDKLVYLGDTLLTTLVACSLHGAYPLLPIDEAKRIQATLLHSSLLGPLSKRLGCHDDSSFDSDPLPRHLAKRLKAYIAAVYFDCLKDRTKLSGDAANLLEMWLGALFAHLGAKVNANGLVDEEPDEAGTGELEVHVVSEPRDDYDRKIKGSPAPREANIEDEVQILDDTGVSPSDSALVNLQNLRKHRVLDFHLHTLCEDQQWRTKLYGEHKGKKFSVSILRSKKKTAEKVTAHLVLRYLGFLGREEAVGAEAASWKDAQQSQSGHPWEAKGESPVRPIRNDKGKKKKNGESQHGDKHKDKGKKKKKLNHEGVRDEPIARSRPAEPEVKPERQVVLEKDGQRVKLQPWLPQQMDQRVMAARF